MRLKTNLVISAVFLALLGFVYFLDKSEKEQQDEEERSKKLIDFSNHEARSIAIVRGDSTIVLEKAEDLWRLVQPIASGADEDAVDRLLNTLRETAVERVVEDSAAVAAESELAASYGFGEPRLRVLLSLSEGSLDTVVFGGDSPTERYAYARRLGANPEIFTVNAWRNDPLIVDAEFASLRIWRNTEIAALQPGERYVSIKGILGHEWDSDIDNGARPPGLFRISATTVDNVLFCLHPGRGCESGTATHNAVLYRHSSGALVFGSGTLQWAWGLDAHHDSETGVPPERANGSNTRVGVDPNGPDKNIQQATLNLFADMGVQPATMQPDLVSSTASTDDIPPTSSIDMTSVAGSVGSVMTIRGSASDRGGGVVAAVELSLDGGTNWHPAIGRTSWSYEWTPDRAGTVSIHSRAVDDSGNLGDPGEAVTVRVAAGD